MNKPFYQLRASVVDDEGNVSRPSKGQHPQFWSVYRKDSREALPYWVSDHDSWRAAHSAILGPAGYCAEDKDLRS